MTLFYQLYIYLFERFFNHIFGILFDFIHQVLQLLLLIRLLHNGKALFNQIRERAVGRSEDDLEPLFLHDLCCSP